MKSIYRCTSKFSTRRSSHACNTLCRCPLCLKAIRKTSSMSQIQDPSNINLPNQSAYKFFCDQIVNSPIRQYLRFNIMSTFFFENGKVDSHYYNAQDGSLLGSSVKGMKEVERILMDKKYRPAEKMTEKIERKFETAKEAVARKVKNVIGVMILNDGSLKLLNELNLSYQINTTKNICFIKSYYNSKLSPIYYKHAETFESNIYKRARTYLKVLSRQITPLQDNYITKQQQSEYQQQLRSENIQKYLLYLTCKLVELAFVNEHMLIKSGVFIWVINQETMQAYFGNVHQVKYSLESNPDQLLNQFISKKKNQIEKKLSCISKFEFKQQPSERVQSFSNILQSSFKIAISQLAPNIQLHIQKQKIQVDQTFRKFHPNVGYNLSDIVGNNQKFNSEMKKLFAKRFNKKSLVKTSNQMQNPEIKTKKTRWWLSSQQMTSMEKTFSKSRNQRILSHQKLPVSDSKATRANTSKSFRLHRLSTQHSSKILQ